jgi:hypothetical protein
MKAIAVFGFILAGFTGGVGILLFVVGGKTDVEVEKILPLLGAAVAWVFASSLIYLLAQIRDVLAEIRANTNRLPFEKA